MKDYRLKWVDDVVDYLDTVEVKYDENTEYSIYLPDYKVAIDFYSLYHHSDLKGGKDKTYHFNKWKKAQDNGITLYSYFEDELITSFPIILNKIRYIVSKNTQVIGGRKCVIGDTLPKQERDFLNSYHIQGGSNARNKTIGAYHNNLTLVAIMSWLKKPKYLEITRFACDSKASYPGLFSKMMKHMIKELDYKGPIVSFSNNGHSNGGVYNASGFTNVNEQKGAYWYTHDYLERENRQSFMKINIKQKFNLTQEYVDAHTEWQMMQEFNYDRVWDSGKIKWELIIT